jgi:hypothetical protein
LPPGLVWIATSSTLPPARAFVFAGNPLTFSALEGAHFILILLLVRTRRRRPATCHFALRQVH